MLSRCKYRLPVLKEGITIKTNIPSVVPDDLVGVKLRLKQILLNLVGNAVKFTDRGSVTILVTMLERRDDKALLRFDVTDYRNRYQAGIHREDICSL